jgi:hypothetical protein
MRLTMLGGNAGNKSRETRRKSHGRTHPKDVQAHFDHGRIKRWGDLTGGDHDGHGSAADQPPRDTGPTARLFDANAPGDGRNQLGRVVAHAVLEHRRHLPDDGRVRG